jgi:hypothetical protein
MTCAATSPSAYVTASEGLSFQTKQNRSGACFGLISVIIKGISCQKPGRPECLAYAIP